MTTADKSVHHKGRKDTRTLGCRQRSPSRRRRSRSRRPSRHPKRARMSTALASERLEGRLVGSNGEQLASDYLVSQLRRIGARPLPGQNDFLLPFEFTAGTRDGGSTATRHRHAFERRIARSRQRAEVQALSFSDNGDASGPVVFAGYGIVVPEAQNFGYDSYATLDVKDKVVLVLRYFPEDADVKTKGILARYADLRYKAMAARQRGAKAIAGRRRAARRRTPAKRFRCRSTRRSPDRGSLPRASAVRSPKRCSPRSAIRARRSPPRRRRSMMPIRTSPASRCRTSPSTCTPTSCARSAPGTTSSAYLPATVPIAGVEKPWVALGAHYDHLGHGENGNSLADKTEAGASTTARTTTRRDRPRCSPSARRSPRGRATATSCWHSGRARSWA